MICNAVSFDLDCCIGHVNASGGIAAIITGSIYERPFSRGGSGLHAGDNTNKFGHMCDTCAQKRSSSMCPQS